MDTRQDADSIPTRISTWADLASLVEFFSYFSGRDWLFRGVVHAGHGLIPKIGRPNARAIKNGVRLVYSRDDEESIIAMFNQQAMPYLAAPPQTELGVCPEPTNALAPKFIKKIIVDHAAKFTIKKRLNSYGVNRRALFPDLGGLCDHLTWMYRHDWLSGYRKEPPGILALMAAEVNSGERPSESISEDKFDDE